MTKTDKKIEKAITRALTDVCETARLASGSHELKGFEWITHFVQYPDYLNSLLIVCVFDTDEERLNALNEGRDNYLMRLIRDKLKAENIHIKAIEKRVRFDSEESCAKQHNGNWLARYRMTRH